MKHIILAIVLLLPLTGCADKQAYQAYMASYQASAEAYYLAAAEPLLEVELPSPVDGQPYKIKVSREVKPMSPEQIKDSEWAGVARTAVGVVGTVGTAYVIADGVVNLASEVGKASGIHVNGNNAQLDNVANRASADNHGTATAGGTEETRLWVEGEGTSGSLDNSSPSTSSETHETTTTTDITTTTTNTSTEVAP